MKCPSLLSITVSVSLSFSLYLNLTLSLNLSAFLSFSHTLPPLSLSLYGLVPLDAKQLAICALIGSEQRHRWRRIFPLVFLSWQEGDAGCPHPPPQPRPRARGHRWQSRALRAKMAAMRNEEQGPNISPCRKP